MSGHFPALQLGGSFADIYRSGQLAGEPALGARCRSTPRLFAPQISDRFLLNPAFGVDVDEVVDGFVAHASDWIMRVASAQGDFDLLGSGSGLQQGQQVAMEGGRISDFCCVRRAWADDKAHACASTLL